jgi:hypothetical protein
MIPHMLRTVVEWIGPIAWLNRVPEIVAQEAVVALLVHNTYWG